MVRTSDNRVRLAPADWGGLCSIALTIVTLVAATLYTVNEIAVTNRQRLAAIDAELISLQRSINLLQSDLRNLARRMEK